MSVVGTVLHTPGVGSTGASFPAYPTPPPSSMTTAAKLQPLTPPHMFSIVENDVYRCAYPGTAHARYLQTLNLRTVVTLSLEAIPMQSRRMLEGQGARVVPLGGAAWGRYHNFDPDLIVEALRLLLDAEHHPLLLTCATGELQTNAVVGCLRRLQHWCLSSVYSEMTQHQSPRGLVPAHRTAILEAIEKFDPQRFFASNLQPRIVAQQRSIASERAKSALADPIVGGDTSGMLTESPMTCKGTPLPAAATGPAAAVTVGESPTRSAVDAPAPPLPLARTVPTGDQRLSPTEAVNAPMLHVPPLQRNGAVSTVDLCPEPTAAAADDGWTLEDQPWLAAPIPAWYIRGLRHRLAALRAQQGSTMNIHPAAAVEGSAGATGVGGPRPHRALPHDIHRFDTLAPLISDRQGYNAAESLVDSDDD